ncbi:MAG: hypothetical protein CV089_08610, partial [Nitrospira sp. WS110]|nr:hypothetical protein [Nitrospira sp. WS110]
MKQTVQHYHSGTVKVEDVPTPSLRGAGLLVLNAASLISPGTEKSIVQGAHKSLLGKVMERPERIKKVLASVHTHGLADTLKRLFDRLDTPPPWAIAAPEQSSTWPRMQPLFRRGSRGLRRAELCLSCGNGLCT